MLVILTKDYLHCSNKLIIKICRIFHWKIGERNFSLKIGERNFAAKMYGEWVSLSSQITANSCGAQSYSVLNKFPASAGREVAVSVVRQLATNLGITQNAEPSHLVKDEEVNHKFYK